ncbi:hypothetical protein BYT27DRAFT_7184109 [Phlegmacium glaucopus]|nr:hypothetical protein BYT27DRAFT_7184109 [Phlegmacium glaucopus]
MLNHWDIQLSCKIFTDKGRRKKLEKKNLTPCLCDDDDEIDGVIRAQAIMLCKQMERLSPNFGDPSTSLGLTKQLRKFRAHLRHEALKTDSQR